MMRIANASSPEVFILLGFSARPSLEPILFIFVLIFYVVSIAGNSIIILVSCMDVRLHTPMYFFLTNLSFLDITFITSIVPQLLVNLWGPEKIISYEGCVVQFYISHWMGATECVLLAVMSYDRYTAICRPLHYAVIMQQHLCVGLAFTSWLGGLITSLVGSTLTILLPLCGNNHIDHFFCEMPLILQLACVDTSLNEIEMYLASFIVVVLPLGLILVSYGHIARAVLKIRSAEGRRKAFNTCSSHVAVVSLFYGSIIFMYLQPAKSNSHEQGKFIALFYTVVTPMLNPLIYTLRNKDVKRALNHILLENCCGFAEK
ncbi:PREDICTED: olfactory receptor 2C3-like [Elephantulus edwardii]|uniref:olfactory receptor 2C3-like n=1 Tax=Elephantulus edwardii TaxID=28737 RepID=UPI0003F09148|nr:PREDICTED: olfactory receptor 2C3-like [Elephantulus edwardii]